MESRLEELDSIVYVLYFDEDSKKKRSKHLVNIIGLNLSLIVAISI